MRIGLDSDPDSESSSSLCSSSGQVNFQSKLTKKDKGKARLIDSDFHDSIISSPNLTKTNPSGIRGNLANKKLIPPWIARQRQQLTTQRRSKIRFSPSSTNNSEVSSEDFDQEQNEDEDTDTDSDSNLSDHSESEGDGEGEDQNRDTQDNSDLDSEEEQWPVNPGKSNNQSKQERNRLKRDQEVVKRLIRLQSSDGTGLEESQNQIARTYSKATRNYTAKLRSLSLAPIESNPRNSRQTTSIGREASEARAWLEQKEMDQVNGILESLQLKAKEDERKEEVAFEERQRVLWKSVECSILAAEKERDEALAIQAARLTAARKAAEERERLAKEAREAEERRIVEERRIREEAENQRREEERREREEQIGGGLDLKREAKVEWESWKEVMKNIKEKVLPYVSGNGDLRKQCFAAKRQITPKVGQLTNSRQEITRITISISEVLSSARNVSTPSGESEVYIWILNHLSKCFIRQSEQEVSVKQDTAFPLARVVRWLIDGGHEKLGEILMARLVKKCPWVLGFCPERKESDTDETYSKSLGKSDPSETSVQYSSRMSGILAFYFAILQTERISPPSPLSSLNPSSTSLAPEFRPSRLWTWQARAITPPLTNHGLLPTLWCCFLEIAGPRALNVYGKQTEKVWKLLLVKGIREENAGFVREETARPATARLRILLESWEKDGGIRGEGGREMEN